MKSQKCPFCEKKTLVVDIDQTEDMYGDMKKFPWRQWYYICENCGHSGMLIDMEKAAQKEKRALT